MDNYLERIHKAAYEYAKALADGRFVEDNITDSAQKEEIRKQIQHEVAECRKRVVSLPYSSLEEKSAVLSMLAEHTCMQIMKAREGEMISMEEISWLVNEMQDGVQKLSEIVDRIIKHERTIIHDSKLMQEIVEDNK